jgi:uncharacterized membrane protein
VGGGGGRERFPFIDQFRGLVGVMMALGHSSSAFNGVWKTLNMIDPFFSSFGQFALRYMGYLCAPGFLMMNGAVSWYSYTRRIAAGASTWQAKWHLIQRGLFLILVQVTIVNLAWVSFRFEKYDFTHIGIISTIGISMCILALFIHLRWQYRALIGIGTFIAQGFLLMIPYNPAVLWQKLLMETFVHAGDGVWNKYPVVPWFGLATMGSVMASGWMSAWKTFGERLKWTMVIGFASLLVATAIRMGRGFGNLSPFDEFGHYSFFLDTKYPPNLFHNFWFFGAVCVTNGVIQIISHYFSPAVKWLGAIGRVPLFFYVMHISILFIVADRFGVFYRQGGVLASFIGWVCLLMVMWPLARWFGGVKARSKRKIIQLI